VAPFIEDVPARLAACHLAVSRSGASTVAELAVAGRPAVLVPYPHATDDHQTDNAQALTAAGAAVTLAQPQFTAATLAARISEWIADPATLGRMA
ncbi:glycosyltransferase, partial [Klebsiella pneumoniae]